MPARPHVRRPARPSACATSEPLAAVRSRNMNIFTIIGVVVVVLFVIGYFGLH